MGDDLKLFSKHEEVQSRRTPLESSSVTLTKRVYFMGRLLVFCQPGGLFWSNLTQLHHSVTFKDCNFVHQQLM